MDIASPDLNRYSSLPLFNGKAVAQATGVSVSVLRAWETRYGILTPDRSASNYRLYSEREIELIRWLKARTDAGWPISKAIEWYRENGTRAPLTALGSTRPAPDLKDLHSQFLEFFLAFDEDGVDTLLNRMFALYSLEEVLGDLLHPVVLNLGTLARQGEVSRAVGYFASGYAKRKFTALLNAQPYHERAPLIITGCAPHDKHDLDTLLISLLLRRAGWRLLYLGQNVPLVDLQATLETIQPVMLLLSATTEIAAVNLIPIAEMIADLPPTQPVFGFCGYAFEHNPVLVENIASGVYLGGATPQVVTHLACHHLEHALTATRG
jgi:DNA-binding transcriptional MerR regulator